MSTIPQSQSPSHWDRILSVSQKNQPDEIRRLVQQEGISPSHANRINQSALHIAALWGHVESVAVLIELGANVNATNQLTGGSPLHAAIHSSKASEERQAKCVELLLQGGADVSLEDNYGSVAADYCENDKILQLITPNAPGIFCAANSLQELRAFLQTHSDENDFDVNVCTGGMTLLVQLVEDLLQTISSLDQEEDLNEMVDLIQLLLRYKADPNAIPKARPTINDDFDDTISNDSALMRTCLGLRDLYQTNQHNQHHEQVLRKTTEMLLEAGANIKQEEEAFQHLLLDAARRNQVGFVTFLLQELKMSPNVKGRQGMTALQFAARSGKVEMASCLLACPDIDINLTDDRGQTALDAARVNNKQEIVSLLEQYQEKVSK